MVLLQLISHGSTGSEAEVMLIAYSEVMVLLQ